MSGYIDSAWLRAMVQAKNNGGWRTLGKDNLLIAALACSKNYFAPAHKDNDFFFSAHQINTPDDYVLDMDIVQYFCFPQYGFAVALRPGDVILFNPKEYHCLSKKEKSYNQKDVHVTTGYLKTAHVGKNDNDLSLTEQEEFLYTFPFK